ncbi:SDR family oxidoreductase [Actinomadura spongiicola]|uniref:SDR family oxidoreductase n=1 Tax=Actinomadura spongiicola TaxID=2303421 RepID=A0A372GGR7_9ACTN|nr:SDR family NAD(P)-dependent oxidoreductase [Actinomadura spongiicola]RFS84289.1 SDR family oxidoreductase [Actinomadura spongiicola]
MRRFDGQVAIVTGGTSGIGREVCLALAAEGARVVVSGTDEARGEATCEAARAEGGIARFAGARLNRVEDCHRLVDGVLEREGAIDVLVNAAGVFEVGATPETAEAAWDRMSDVNLKGLFFTGQRALTVMAGRGSGVVVNISSIGALVGAPGIAAYCAIKGGVEALTRAWAVEFAPQGVRVNAVAPGNVETPMNAQMMARPEHLATILERTPLGRNGRPHEIAGAVLYLAGPEAQFVTGASLVVDGGWTAQ